MEVLVVGALALAGSVVLLCTGGGNTYEFVSFEPYGDNTKAGTLTLRKTSVPTRLERLIGHKSTTLLVSFFGSGAVWHHGPDGERCNSFLEAQLCNYWSLWDHQQRKVVNLDVHRTGRH